LTSCDPAKHIARVLKRHPELVKTDTVWKQDSVIVAGASKDSTFSFYQHDTVTLKQNNMTVKYFFNHDSTIYLSGKCDPVVKKYFYPVVHTIASIPKQLTFNEKVILWVSRNWWWLLGIYFLLRILWKTFGKALQAIYPWMSIFGFLF
jgi:hypothetical protein